MARLKVFVFNHIAEGMQAQPLPAALRRQGDLLFQALVTDLGALAGVDLVTHADSGVAPARAARLDGLAVEMAAGEAPASPYLQATGQSHSPPFGTHIGAPMLAADAVWPLALESGGMLERLSRDVLGSGRILLGSTPAAVQTAASKLRLAQVLADGGVTTVATYSPHGAIPQHGGPWVVKPDDGAGCLHTRLFGDSRTALAWIRASAVDGYVLQPFVAGILGSLSLICCDGTARLLACNRERVAMRDNRFQVLGSIVNGLEDEDGVLAQLAQQVAAAIPSLWGYVGVDFVLGAEGAVVLDVNPRLTIAYAGLHASTGCNPAGLVLDLLTQPLVAPAPAPAGVRRAVSVDIGQP